MGWLEATLRAAIQGSGNTSLAAVAAAAGLHPRTLQRRLRDAGVTHRGLLERVRISLAREYLADPRNPLARIAFRLGYSQASAFNRAFKRETGLTPMESRREGVPLKDPLRQATPSRGRTFRR
jgi:AraC-like DNA-binding protein